MSRIHTIATCFTCPAWKPADPAKPKGFGICHGATPVPLMKGLAQTPLGPQSVVEAHFPGIDATNFCMAHPDNRHLMEGRRPAAMPLGETSPIPPQQPGKRTLEYQPTEGAADK